MSSAVKSEAFATSNFFAVCFPSVDIRTLIILRFSPRTIDFTVPLTGLTNFIDASFLSKNRTSPTFTTSPSLTTILGVNP